MNTFIHEKKYDRVPDYVLEILSEGKCPALICGGRFSFDGRSCIAYDDSGLQLLSAYAFEHPDTAAMLALAEGFFRSLIIADDWLIPFSCLDFSGESMRMDSAQGIIRFRLAERPRNQSWQPRDPAEHPCTSDFTFAIMEIGKYFPSAGARTCSEKITAAVQGLQPDAVSLLRFCGNLRKRSSSYALKREICHDIGGHGSGTLPACKDSDVGVLLV